MLFFLFVFVVWVLVLVCFCVLGGVGVFGGGCIVGMGCYRGLGGVWMGCFVVFCFIFVGLVEGGFLVWVVWGLMCG